MNDQRDKDFVQRSINSCLSSVQGNPQLAQRIMRQERTENMVVKKKMSFSLVLAIIIISITVTALAAGIAFHVMTSRVAEMDAKGQMTAWGLPEKYAFVQAMRESGFEMNESDWQILSDFKNSDEERQSAADRIIYARYGSVLEEENATRPFPADSVMGSAPDPVLIFRERYLAENPEATDYDYMDALGYWLRDEYMPQYEAARKDASPTGTLIPVTPLTKELAEESARSHLTEIFNWPVGIVSQATLVSELDEQSGAWHIVAEIPEDKLRGALDPVLEDDMLQKKNKDYVFSYWVTRSIKGTYCRSSTLESLLEMADDQNHREALYSIDTDQAEKIAVTAIQNKYQLENSTVKKYFVYEADTYTSDRSCIRVGFILRTRNNNAAPWDYAAVVNLTTGIAEDVFTAEDLLGEKLELLASAWDKLQPDDRWLDYYRWYTTWCPYDQFAFWPVSVQAKASWLFWKAGEKQRSELSEPGAYYPLQMFTNHLYSEPTAEEISEESALQIAHEKAAQGLNLDINVISTWKTKRTYSRDQGSNPIWRILLYTDPTPESPWQYIIWVDGVTGEILYADQVSPTGDSWYPDTDVL